MSTSSYHNLLFGIIALQTETISKDQLVSAIHTWTGDKSRGIGEILVAEKALDQENYAALQALVDHRLRQGIGSIAESLTRLDASDEFRSLLAELPESEIPESLRGMTLPGDTLGETRPGSYSTDYSDSAATSENQSTDGIRYQKLNFHDEGGLGRVYLARDTELGRKVALKELKPRVADSGASRSRFVTEAEITGGLEHPGIVSVYGLGRYSDGRPYYAMQFIQGENLRKKIAAFHKRSKKQSPAKTRVELRRLLTRFIDACHAIHYAHMRGVLHRDIKPGNIMIGRYGETLVVDWGLAKWQDSESPMPTRHSPTEETLIPLSGSMVADTMLGSAVGTPYFMSPEQARGEHNRVGPETDVYSLGATLFVLITNHRPFEGEDNVIDAAKQGKVVRPRSVDPRVPKALDAICLKAMAPKVEDRYPSAQALADDVEQYLADEKVAANRETVLEKLQRLVRRHRTLTVSTLLAVTTIAIVSLLANYLINKQKRLVETQKAEAVVARDRADEAEERTGESLSFLVDILRSPSTSDDGRAVTVAACLDHAVEKSAEKTPLVRSTILTSISKTYLQLGMDHESAKTARLAFDLSNATLGPDAPETLDAQNVLGTAMLLGGHPKQACPLLMDNVDRRERVLGRNDTETLKTKANLANCLFALGSRDEAIANLKQVLERKKEVLGTDHKDLVPTMSYLAGMYMMTGELKDGIALFDEAFRIRIEQLGESHPLTLKSQMLLLTANAEAGATGELIENYDEESVLERIKKVHGDSTYIAMSLNLARAYQQIGYLDKAQTLIEQAIGELKVLEGDQHPDTLAAMDNLAALFLTSGDLQKARPLYEHIRKVRLERLDDHHPDVLRVENDLALTLAGTGDVDAAIAIWEPLVAKRKAVEPDEITTIDTIHELAETYIQAHRFVDAEPLARSLVQQVKDLTQDAVEQETFVGRANTTLAAALLGMGRDQEAAVIANDAAESLPDADIIQRARAQNIHGAALHALGEADEAERLLVASSEILLATKQHPAKLWMARRAVQRTIDLYEDLDRSEESDKWQKSLEMRFGVGE